MKRIPILTMALGLSIAVSYGQSELDAYKMSRNDLTGTARGVSMGGAFGALGGDLTGVAINPAGIGVYTKSEVAATINFQSTKSEANFGGSVMDKSQFKPVFDNFGAVISFALDNDDVPFFNVGVSYNRLKTFNRKYNTAGVARGSSLTDFMALRAGDAPKSALSTDNDYAWVDEDWLGVFGYNAGLIVPDGGGGYQSSINLKSDPSRALIPENQLAVNEKSSISSYDFSFGTTISNMISLGLTLAVTDIDYKQFSSLSEDFYDGVGRGGYDLHNSLKTEGTGWQVKLGAIFKPINELRIGVSYHSPTWYHMTDYTTAALDHNLEGLKGGDNMIAGDYVNGTIYSHFGDGRDVHDYKLRTPDKFVFSLAGIIGNRAVISADYELTNYKSNMRLNGRNGDLVGDHNPLIKKDFKMASTARIGAEFKVTNQFAIRAGYAWMESALKDDFKNNKYEVLVQGSIPFYTMEGDRHHYTAGLGYRFTPNIYADLGFVMSQQKDHLYLFPRALDNDGYALTNPDKIDLKTKRFQGLLTIGFRF